MNLAKVACLTGNGTFTVPADWNSASNTVEIIAPGGQGGVAANSFQYGSGGGAYTKKINLTLTPNGSVAYQTSPLADGCFVNCSTVKAQMGQDFNFSSGQSGAGGKATNSIGDVKFDGGDGFGVAGRGGGGAAGPNGAGQNGGTSTNVGGNGDAGFGGIGTTGNGAPGAEYTCMAGLGGNVTGSAGSGAGAGNPGTTGGLYGGGSYTGTRQAGLIILTWTPRKRVSSGAF